MTLMCVAGLASASGYGHGSALALLGGGHGGYYGGHGSAHNYGPAPLAHDGRVVDTPEVAHAKAAHLAAHAAASHAAPAHGGWSGGHGGYAPAPVYTGHASYAPAAHGAWAPAHGGYAPAADYGKWTGPPAHIELTHDGKFLKDTPEVSHAKAAHAAAFAAAAHAAASSPDYHSYESAHGSGYGSAHGSAYGSAYGHGHGWKANFGTISLNGVNEFSITLRKQFSSKKRLLLQHPKMNSMFVVALLCFSAFVAAEDDGSWKGEGIAESQDFGQYNAYAYSPYYSPYYHGGYYGYGAPLAPNGQVLDTPEVAQAKAAHFAAYNVAAAKAGAYPYAYPYYNGYWAGYGSPVELTADGKFVKDTPEVALAKSAHFAAHAAASTGVVAAAGPAETPEVVQAKAAHFAAYNVAAARSGAYPYHYGYYGSPVELTADGKFLKDTPEVALAKSQHFAALSAAQH
ncbi:uncharacterized protein LOC143912603 [Arctopsyche grandis]|uniref:uncharacterized protein LOC143912603 n=1 Tax=Arctopsyche grandis TaxID=121162 RepID=UPI00406D7B4D